MSVESANESRFKKGIMVLSPLEGELLEALENLENDDDQMMPKSAWELVQSAIAKAYGETL
jgi:hypothetical protein